MPNLVLQPRKNHLIRDAYLDFELSRKAMLCSENTIQFYQYTAKKFIEQLPVDDPKDVTAHHVRAYLSGLASRGLKDSTVHGHARAIRCFLRFCAAEGYCEPVTFDMPRQGTERPPMLSAEDLKRVLAHATKPRDKALVLLLVDFGVRRAECAALRWKDIDMNSGVLRVNSGKGKKARTAIIGPTTRRGLLKHRRKVSHEPGDSVFRLTGSGVRMALRRLGDRAGVTLTCHMLRRTFATAALTGGMSPLVLQSLMGHSDLEMTRRYLRLVDTDLIEQHRAHGPVDRLLG